MHVEAIRIFQSYLRKKVVDSLAENELYVQIKDTILQPNFKNRYEGYDLEDDGLITYKNRRYIPTVENLRIIVMDEIHKMSYFGHLGYQITIDKIGTNIFGQK